MPVTAAALRTKSRLIPSLRAPLSLMVKKSVLVFDRPSMIRAALGSPRPRNTSSHCSGRIRRSRWRVSPQGRSQPHRDLLHQPRPAGGILGFVEQKRPAAHAVTAEARNSKTIAPFIIRTFIKPSLSIRGLRSGHAICSESVAAEPRAPQSRKYHAIRFAGRKNNSAFLYMSGESSDLCRAAAAD